MKKARLLIAGLLVVTLAGCSYKDTTVTTAKETATESKDPKEAIVDLDQRDMDWVTADDAKLNPPKSESGWRVDWFRGVELTDYLRLDLNNICYMDKREIAYQTKVTDDVAIDEYTQFVSIDKESSQSFQNSVQISKITDNSVPKNGIELKVAFEDLKKADNKDREWLESQFRLIIDRVLGMDAPLSVDDVVQYTTGEKDFGDGINIEDGDYRLRLNRYGLTITVYNTPEVLGKEWDYITHKAMLNDYSDLVSKLEEQKPAIYRTTGSIYDYSKETQKELADNFDRAFVRSAYYCDLGEPNGGSLTVSFSEKEDSEDGKEAKYSSKVRYDMLINDVHKVTVRNIEIADGYSSKLKSITKELEEGTQGNTDYFTID